MTRSTRIYGKVALLMAGILAASVLLTLAVGVDRRPAGKTRIVASFYPVYIAALNLADGVEGVEVVSLTGPTTGCLHDYQLSPDNRITLSGASVLAVNGDGTLLLQAGRMKMTVKAQQVRLLEGAPKKSKPAPSPSAATLNTVSRASSELDIRGYETLEAESVVENYLDSAVMAKLGTVTIIHGKGTGALRKAVHEILKRNKAVKSFRLGRYGEGEAGVTVVELK